MPRAVKIPPATELLNAEQAAAYLGVAVRTLHKWAAEGRLTVYKLGHLNRYAKSDLDALIVRRSA